MVEDEGIERGKGGWKSNASDARPMVGANCVKAESRAGSSHACAKGGTLEG